MSLDGLLINPEVSVNNCLPNNVNRNGYNNVLLFVRKTIKEHCN